MKMRTLSAAVAAVLAMWGCGGGSDDPAVRTGRLVDSAVEGIEYSTASRSGTTGPNGEFSYLPGETVTFRVGGIVLGSAPAGALVTPLELAGTTDAKSAKVANRLVLLQSLDDDDDPSNGIRIGAAVRAALKDATLDLNADAAAFDGELAQKLPTVTDSFGKSFKDRSGAGRRALAVDHFEGTLASTLGKSATSTSTQPVAGTVEITKHTVVADASLYVPYEGANAAVKTDFPKGFFPAVGSGLAFKGRAADGSLEFWGITDRGPNGDGPTAPTALDASKNGISKVFPAPNFAPAIGVISVGANGAQLKSLMPLKVDAATKVSGRPLAPGAVGASGETPLTDALRYEKAKLDFDANGLDTESLVYDAASNAFWTSDEYGPFIVKIDAASGRILKKYVPGAGLPAVLALRRANRGMEGLAMDPAGRLHGFLQSPIDPLDAGGKSVETTDASDLDKDGKTTDKVKLRDHAQFVRWLKFDPATEQSAMYAYPLAGAMYDKSRQGNAKLGDVTAIAGDRFLVIEQGAGPDGKVHNYLMLVEIPAGATNIVDIGMELEKNSIDGATAAATPWSAVVPLRKRLLLDLNAAGWLAEKAEGLTLVDERTIALINDNDFGVRSRIVDANGAFLDGSIEDCTVDVNGTPVSGCPAGAVGSRVTRGSDAERPTRLWLIKFPKKLSEYAVGG